MTALLHHPLYSRVRRHGLRALALCAASLAMPVFAAPTAVTWISSTAEQPWQQMPAPVLGPGTPDSPPQVRVTTTKTYQSIDGFGGCFIDLGWVALG